MSLQSIHSNFLVTTLTPTFGFSRDLFNSFESEFPVLPASTSPQCLLKVQLPGAHLKHNKSDSLVWDAVRDF